MVTTFNTKDLTSFGQYLLSAERRERIKMNPNFQDHVILEERLSEVHHADIANWKDSFSSVQKVRAKFVCNNVDAESEHDTQNVHMNVVVEDTPENKEFSELTPYGEFNLGIDKGAPALELFEEGREYYIDIIKAPIE